MNLLPIEILVGWTPVFILVMFRITGIFIFAPILGSLNIPMRIKALIALALAAAVFPIVVQSGLLSPAVAPTSLWELGWGVAMELLIGLGMGFALMLMFVAVQLGAELISQQMALNLGRIIDPITGDSTDIVAQFYMMLTTLIYVLINGPAVMIRALVDTFFQVPLMGARPSEGLLTMFGKLLSTSFSLGVRIAGPALAAIFLSTLAMGFISRTMPQLNILAAGFPLRICLSMAVLIFSIGSVCLLLENYVVDVLNLVGRLFVV